MKRGEDEKHKRFQQAGDAKNLFRKIARRAQICLSWVRSVFKLRDNWMEKQLVQFSRDAVGLESNLHSKQLGLAGTVFNVQEYSPNREIELKREVLDTLTLLPEGRTNQEVRKVLAGLQAIKSFSEYPDHVQEKLCQVAWYQKVPPKKVIIRQGHTGLNFYFVISGHGIIKVVRRRSDGVILPGEKVVFRVKRGCSFGDIALLHNVERTATVESVTEMSLLVIGRDDFLRIFMQREAAGVASDHVSFLAMVNAFKWWPIEEFSKSKEACVFHYFKRGKVIVADSNASNFLYVIKAGTCEVLKQLKSVKPRTSLQSERMRRKRHDKMSAYTPSIGYSANSSIPGRRRMPVIENKVLSVDGEEMVKSSLYKVCRARMIDPKVTVDLPRLIMADLDEVQRETFDKYPNSKPSMAAIVAQLLNNKESNSGESGILKSAKADLGTREEILDDQAYRKSQRPRQLSRLQSLACVANRSSKIDGKTQDNRENGDPEYPKSKLRMITNKWKFKTKESTNHYKEMNVVRQYQTSPDMLMKSPTRKQVTYNNIPDINSTWPLLLAHEGKQQSIPTKQQGHRGSTKHPPVFVRLALLRPKDVFGLDTLEFDDNYKKTDTSVSLISRGAEVLMISKEFFLKNCTSENLEHLRNVIAPYPCEEAMQHNLQVSSDWKLYCNQQLRDALIRRTNTYLV